MSFLFFPESTEVSWHSPDPTQVSEKLHVSRVRLWRYKWCKVVDPNEKRTQQVASGSSVLASTSTPLTQTLLNCCCKRKSNKPIGKWRHICCPSAAYVSANKEDSSSRNTERQEVDSGQPAPASEASTPISNNATATSDSPDEGICVFLCRAFQEYCCVKGGSVAMLLFAFI